MWYVKEHTLKVQTSRIKAGMSCMLAETGTTHVLGMGDYENMSQQLSSVQVSWLLRLLATLHMYVDFIQQSNWYLLFVE